VSQILVIEDQPEQRGQLVRILSKEGQEVTGAANGKEALVHLTTRTPDVAVVDIHLPQMDGLELIGVLRSRFPATRIVAISGGGMVSGVDYLTVANLLGADRTLEKPIWPHRLREVVGELLLSAGRAA